MAICRNCKHCLIPGLRDRLLGLDNPRYYRCSAEYRRIDPVTGDREYWFCSIKNCTGRCKDYEELK